jgi:hypothetical protein
MKQVPGNGTGRRDCSMAEFTVAIVLIALTCVLLLVVRGLERL